MQDKHPSSKCLLMNDFPLGQVTPANAAWRQELEANGSVCSPFFGHDVPPDKTCFPTLTLLRCRQQGCIWHCRKPTPSPTRRDPGMGLVPSQLLHSCSITFPAPCAGCVLERAAADYHHASHIRGMCCKEHYSSQPPTSPCLKLKA